MMSVPIGTEMPDGTVNISAGIIEGIWQAFGTQLFTHGYSREEFEWSLHIHDQELYDLLKVLLSNGNG